MKLGCQLYNLGRSPLSFRSKLEVIKTLGYDGLELAGFGLDGYGSTSAEEFKAMLEEIGLEISGAHVPYPLLNTNMDEIIAYHKTLGVKMIGISRPMLPMKEGESREEYFAKMRTYPDKAEEIIQIMDEVKVMEKKLADAGLQLYYHIHNHEYQNYGGQVLIDRLLNETEVPLEPDICWATKDNVLTPAELTKFILDNKDRVKWLHLKGNDNNVSCPLDQGQLDIKFYYDLAKGLGHDYVIVEDDTQKPDSITGIARSMMALRSFEA